MNNKELSGKFLEGMDKALRELVQKKAILNQSFVTSNTEGVIKVVTAKKALRKLKNGLSVRFDTNH